MVFIQLCREVICIFKLYRYQKSINKACLSLSAEFLNEETYVGILIF